MILSMVPLIGTNLVLAPAGIALLLSGDVAAGLAMVALGYGGVVATQNLLLRPKTAG